jgi:hypothetical protein
MNRIRSLLIAATIGLLIVIFMPVVRDVSASPPSAARDNAKRDYLVLASTQALEVLQQSHISPEREYTFANGNRATKDFVTRQLQDAIMLSIAVESRDTPYTPPYIDISPSWDGVTEKPGHPAMPEQHTRDKI